jgi:alkylhydroperoxidase/carboxymuconolactone decarboxylase family protein YurZ
MPAIAMVPEEEATGKVKAIYAEIKNTFDIDFVPNLYRVMAPNPAYLEANWNKTKAVMVDQGVLDRLTKEIIAVAVSAVNSCDDLTASPYFCGAEIGFERPRRA